MPFYDYKCKSCGNKFEVNKGMNDPAAPQCPKCGAPSGRVFYAPRTMKSAKDILDSAGSKQSGACSTCSSGVCSTCGTR